MARIIQGILGAFSGAVGPVVGYTRYGSAFMRSKPGRRTLPPTEKQLANQQAMAAVQAWLKPVKAFVRVGFKNYSAKQHGFGSALSYLKKNALVDGNAIDPARALVSWGALAGASQPEASSEVAGQLQFKWDSEGGSGDDHVMLLAYLTDERESIFTTSGAKRLKKADMLEYDHRYSGKEAHVYIAFITEERTECSTSVYLGKIRLA